MGVLTTIVAANPITAIATAVAALGLAFIEVLHKMNPVVDRLQTFYNLIKSGGNPLTFANLQAQTMADNYKNKADEVSNATKETEKYTKTLNKLNKKTPQSNQGRAKVSTVSEIGLTTKKGDRKEIGTTGIMSSQAASGDIASGLMDIPTVPPEAVETAVAPFKAIQDKMLEINQEISGTMTDGFANIVAGVASGSMNVGQAFGALLGMLGDVATQIGKQAIGIGIAMKAIKMSFKNPATAIGAGIALIALGAAIKSFGAGFSGGGGGGVAAFANGGIVSGPTLGLVGEYSGAKSNPEVIAPLDKLKGMIGNKSQNINVGGSFRVQGQDLVLALQKANKERNRML
jgi:hypothetical protein